LVIEFPVTGPFSNGRSNVSRVTGPFANGPYTVWTAPAMKSPASRVPRDPPMSDVT
jgi:hypothetical protein